MGAIKKIYFALGILLSNLPASYSVAQQSSGTIVVTVDADLLKNAAKPRIRLTEQTSHSIIQETKPDAHGEVVIHDVPFASYLIQFVDGNSVVTSEQITLNSGVPVHVTLSIRKIE